MSIRFSAALFGAFAALAFSAPAEESKRPREAKSGLPPGALLRVASNSNTLQFALTLDGRTAVTGGDGAFVRVWDVDGNKLLRAIKADGGNFVRAFALSPDGRTAAVGGVSETIRLWDVAAGTEKDWQPGRAPKGATAARGGLVFSPDGKLLATFNSNDAHIWDVATGRHLRTLAGAGRGESCRFSPDWRYAVSGPLAPSLTLWEVACGKATPLVGGPPAALAWHPSGRRLAIISGRGEVVVHDVPGGEVRGRIKGRGQPVSAVAFDPLGKTLAVAERPWREGAILLYDAETLRELRNWPAQYTPPEDPRMRQNGLTRAVQYGIAWLGYSPTGDLLISGGFDGRVSFWEVATGQEVCRLPGHADAVRPLAWSADGRRFGSLDAGGTLLVWDEGLFLAGRRELPNELPADELADCWNDLRADPTAAYRAAARLAAARSSLPFLKDCFRQPKPPTPRQVARWIAELDDDEFRIRKRAAEALEEAGEAVEPALERSLKRPLSAEARERVEKLLAKRKTAPLPPERLRLLRAVYLLERVGTPEAGRLLRDFAEANPNSSLGREAAAAAKRLENRTLP